MIRMTLSDQFQYELSQIVHSTVRELVVRILDQKVPQYFSTARAHRHGYKYGEISGTDISLVEQTKEGVRILLTLLGHPDMKKTISAIDRDYMISAMILRDTTKYGLGPNPVDYPVFEHPITVSLLVPDNFTELDRAHFSHIVFLVTTHHGPWNTSSVSKTVLPLIQTQNQYYVHLCDYLSSRSTISTNLSNKSEVTKFFDIT